MEIFPVKYSVVIPVYNGEATLIRLYERLTGVLNKITSYYEIIMVDDESTDKSWEILCGLRERDEKVKLVQLAKNAGQHHATLCGFKYCKGEYVLTMDDDLQHPPEEIPKLITEIQKGYSLVYGRYQKKKHSWFRNLGSALTNKLLADITDNQFDLTSFRMIKGPLIQSLQGVAYPGVILDLWLMRFISKGDISYCDVHHEESQTTHYNFWKLLQIAVNVMMNHTVIPLRGVAFLGVVFSGISFGLGVFYFTRYWLGHIDVSGFTTLVLLITFFSGLLLLALGVIGEYIAALFLILTQKPQSIEKQKRL